ncbi:MAG TPA: TonB family protein [Terriglobales bacterium]|nr:TonB family protein [Terriglobales bacterium]
MVPDRSSEGSIRPAEFDVELLVPWSSRLGVFFRNLRDTLLLSEGGSVEIASMSISSAPATDFWRDVFVFHPSRLRFFFDSYASHVLFVLIIYGLSTSPLFQRRPQRTLNPFQNTHIEYYPVSPYLPPVSTPPKPAKHALKGEPGFAKQEIISVPPEPDNSRQTIVTPDIRILHKEVPLPNVVAWGDKPDPIQPMAASANLSPPKLLLPPDVIAPAPDVVPISSRAIALVRPDVIKPTADLPTEAKARIPTPLTPWVIEPPPTIDTLRTAGAMNIAKLGPQVNAPKLPVAEQRSTGEPGGAAGDAKPGATVPAAPSLQGLSSGKPQGRMLALSVQPADVKGPIEPPAGSRRGIFAAGPEGKPGAPGTPTISGGGESEHGAPGKTGGTDPLQGIYVGPAPDPKASASGAPNSDLRKAFYAAMHAPADIPHRSTADSIPSAPASKIENEVFGNRKSYAMVLNMPNLTSAVGSWVVRYAELTPTRDKSDISAPVALNKVDPAYPPDLIRDRVQGTVVLYAVIRANGTVDSVRVLESVDQRLDQSAIRALIRWHFRPGTKEGVPVDVEAVVQVPFRAEKWKQ